VEQGVALRVSEPDEPEADSAGGMPADAALDGASEDPNAMPAPRTSLSANAVIEMTDRPAKLTVVGRQSIVDYLIERAPRPR
jgi:hypothetical protein